MDVILKIILSLAQRFLVSGSNSSRPRNRIINSSGGSGGLNFIHFVTVSLHIIASYTCLRYLYTSTSTRLYSWIIRHTKSNDQISNKAFWLWVCFKFYWLQARKITNSTIYTDCGFPYTGTLYKNLGLMSTYWHDDTDYIKKYCKESNADNVATNFYEWQTLVIIILRNNICNTL